MSSEKVSIIIPTNNLDTHFEICLASLVDTCNDQVLEIIVVLDGISYDSGFFRNRSFSKLKVFQLDERSGPAEARNEGARVARGGLLFFLDADVAIHSDTIDRICHFFDKNQETIALIGSYDDEPYHQSLVSKFRNLLHHYVHQNSTGPATTFWGACGIIRRKVFLDLGGFDDSFKLPSVEDIELGYRLMKNDHMITLDKSLQVKHLKRWTLISMIKTDIWQRALPWTVLLYQYKNWGFKDLNTGVRDKLSGALIGLLLINIVLSLVTPAFILGVIFTILLLALTQNELYRFFWRYFRFQVIWVVLLHWVYLLSASIGFCLGTLQFAWTDFRK